MNALHGLYRPKTVEEAVALLDSDPDAKLLAGGATLVAMMNARVVEPQALISLSSIDEIKGISVLADGRIRIGAFTRHRETAGCLLDLGSSIVVPRAASQIANATVRNMGTIGGSISFADPGLDYPPAIVAANAEVEIASVHGRRLVSARAFFVDWYTTALEAGEMVTAVILPRPVAGAGVYIKHARVAGDYATAAAAACLQSDGGCRVAVGACGPTPILDDEVNDLLSHSRSDAALQEAGQRLADLADPLDDVRGTAEYRRLLIPRLVARAVRAAETTLGDSA